MTFTIFCLISVAMANDPTVLTKYIAGFNECTSEVTKYLNSVDGLTTDVRTRVLNHLAGSLQRSSVTMATNMQLTSMNQACTQPLGIQIPAATQLPSLPGSGLCVLSPGNQQIQTLSASTMQLVPAKLPTGDTVFLLANPQTLSNQGGCIPLVSAVQNNNNFNNNVNIISAAQSQAEAAATTTATIVSNSNTTNAQFSLSPNNNNNNASEPDSSQSPSGSRSNVYCDSSPKPIAQDNRNVNKSVTWDRNLVQRRTSDEHISHHSSDSSDDDDDDSDIVNNNDVDAVANGPMWRPW